MSESIKYELRKSDRLIESILYLENDPVDIEFIVSVTALSEDEVLDSLQMLKQHYAETDHGIELIEFSGGFHFMPKEDLWRALKEEYGRKIDKRLSRSALETISIIAYSQPITKKEIENIRGVSSDNIIRVLSDREYIEVVGRKDILGRPYLYGTTEKFLRDFNLSSISELPKLDEVNRERFDEEE